MMKYRQPILLALSAICVGGYWFHSYNQETLLGATDNLGQAVLKDDTKTIWSYLPNDERSSYGFDEKKFGKYWNSMIAPALKDFNSCKISLANASGVMLSFSSSAKGMESAKFDLFVSGQMGNYYVPYMVSYSIFNVAGMRAQQVGGARYVHFQCIRDWIASHRRELEAVGVDHMRRGSGFPAYESFDHVDKSLNQAVVHFKEQVSVASR
jgi:hypothetical protein